MRSSARQTASTTSGHSTSHSSSLASTPPRRTSVASAVSSPSLALTPTLSQAVEMADRSSSSDLHEGELREEGGLDPREGYSIEADTLEEAERGGLLSRWRIEGEEGEDGGGWSGDEDLEDADADLDFGNGSSSKAHGRRRQGDDDDDDREGLLGDDAGTSQIDREERVRRRRRRRRVYGGGKHDSGGEKEVWEVALGIASDLYARLTLPLDICHADLRQTRRLSPAALLIPHAFLLLGLPLGLPLLYLTAFLSWFSNVVLVVSGRYVGGRTYAQVASAVFPDRWKGFNVWFGETGVELWRTFVSAGRGMVTMMMVSDLVRFV